MRRLELVDHRLGHRKRRLAEAELEDLLALGTQLIGKLVEGDRRRRGHAADVQVEVNVEGSIPGAGHGTGSHYLVIALFTKPFARRLININGHFLTI